MRLTVNGPDGEIGRHKVSPGGKHHESCGCDGAGWVPVILGPSTLEAALARCGIELRLDNVMNYEYSAVRPYRGQLKPFEASNGYNFIPEDADSITLAKLQAALEVLP